MRKDIPFILYINMAEHWDTRKTFLSKGYKVYPFDTQGFNSDRQHGKLLRFESINALFSSLDLVMTMITKGIRNWTNHKKLT